MPIDNYEQYKRVINQIIGRIYTLETQESLCVCVCVCLCVCGYLLQSASKPFMNLCFEAGK